MKLTEAIATYHINTVSPIKQDYCFGFSYIFTGELLKGEIISAEFSIEVTSKIYQPLYSIVQSLI